MKEGASNSAGTAFESERLRHFPYMDTFSSGEYPVRLRRKCCFHSHALCTIARALRSTFRIYVVRRCKKSHNFVQATSLMATNQKKQRKCRLIAKKGTLGVPTWRQVGNGQVAPSFGARHGLTSQLRLE